LLRHKNLPLLKSFFDVFKAFGLNGKKNFSTPSSKLFVALSPLMAFSFYGSFFNNWPFSFKGGRRQTFVMEI
jgi:hypothetical protein